MTYNITNNPTFNSLEISFNEKPTQKVIDALKNLKFRWHNAKKLWYGFATDTELIKAIQDAEQESDPLATGVIYSDGYLGAIKTDGVNSNKHLYGKDLSEAIRNHIKGAGIKGATVSCKSYAGGQSIQVKIKINPETDLIPLDNYLALYYVSPSNWHYYEADGKTASIHGENYYTLNSQEQTEMKRKFVEYEYNRYSKGEVRLNEYYLNSDKYPEFTLSFFKKITTINEIIRSYRYDDSNAMVDYFDTNFYYDIKTVPTK